MTTPEPRNAWPLVKQRWSECAVEFFCLCGATELYLEDEPSITCDHCRRVYRLHAIFTVEEPPDAHT
jgi:hypothetical protein